MRGLELESESFDLGSAKTSTGTISSVFCTKANNKRRLEDEGTWWLPCLTPPGRRPPWPIRGPTLRLRACWWSDGLDPEWIDSLESKHNEHKALCKNLNLTYRLHDDQDKDLVDGGVLLGGGDLHDG